MPCYDSRNEPEYVRAEAMKEFMHNSPVAEMLCLCLGLLEDNVVDFPSLPPAVHQWWEEHKARDAAREPVVGGGGQKDPIGPGTQSPFKDESEDILVSFGDMTGFNIDSLKTLMEDGVDNNHESMVEEHIKAFNYAVTQGIHPGQALLACIQAIGSLIGFAIRSGMDPMVASAMTALIVKTTQQAATQVRIVTTN
jgi:hypothetical protein